MLNQRINIFQISAKEIPNAICGYKGFLCADQVNLKLRVSILGGFGMGCLGCVCVGYTPSVGGPVSLASSALLWSRTVSVRNAKNGMHTSK